MSKMDSGLMLTSGMDQVVMVITSRRVVSSPLFPSCADPIRRCVVTFGPYSRTDFRDRTKKVVVVVDDQIRCPNTSSGRLNGEAMLEARVSGDLSKQEERAGAAARARSEIGGGGNRRRGCRSFGVSWS